MENWDWDFVARLLLTSHEVAIGSRDVVESAGSCGKRIPETECRGMSNGEAAEWCELAIIAVPYSAHQGDRRASAGNPWQAKIVIDATVPLNPAEFFRIVTESGTSAAEETDAMLDRAFAFLALFRPFRTGFCRKPITLRTFLWRECPKARAEVMQLIRDMNLRPIDAGPLPASGLLERMTALLISINKQEQGQRERLESNRSLNSWLEPASYRRAIVHSSPDDGLDFLLRCLSAIAGPTPTAITYRRGLPAAGSDRSFDIEVINDVAADLGDEPWHEFLEGCRRSSDRLLVGRDPEVRVPAIVELSVFENDSQTTPIGPMARSTPGRQHRQAARTSRWTGLGKMTAQPKPLVGTNGEHLMAVTRSVPNHPGATIVAVTTSLEDLDRFTSLNRRIGAFIFTLAGIAARSCCLNYIFQRKIGRPLDEILAVMEKAHVGDYSERVPQVREDETGQVAQTLNELLDRVEMRSEEKNRLIAEATRGMLESQNRLLQSERLATAGQMAATFAHEIGSPLTSLSAHAELLLEDPEDNAASKRSGRPDAQADPARDPDRRRSDAFRSPRSRGFCSSQCRRDR